MLEQTLQEIDSLKKSLDALRPLNAQKLANIKKSFVLDQTYNSNAIEGSTLTFNETKLIINEGITIGGKTVNEHLEVVNHQDALFYLEQLVNAASPLNESDIKQLHYLILKGINTQAAGVYRSKDVGVRKSDGTIYSFIAPYKITETMQEFVSWAIHGKKLHPVIEAAEMHYQFVTIHPFVDGNGRTARLLMNLTLMSKGYIPALIKIENRAEYILGLEIAQQTADKERFYLAVATAELESLKQYIELASTEIELI